MQKNLIHETAVERVCRRLGLGLGDLALVCDVDASTPSNWNASSTRKNGRDGAIPDRYHRRILAYAKREHIELEPGELVNV